MTRLRPAKSRSDTLAPVWSSRVNAGARSPASTVITPPWSRRAPAAVRRRRLCRFPWCRAASRSLRGGPPHPPTRGGGAGGGGRGERFVDGVATVLRHQLLAEVVIGGMEAEGQAHRPRLLGEAVDPGGDAHGRDGYSSRRDS